jgi:ring-1,2-phenylacetyl-CoA epoxidase subunit PaaC
MDRGEAIVQFATRLGDDTMVLAHRMSEWCSNGPFLEEDIAMSNIALDLFGQSRIIYTYAGEQEGKGRTEDDFAYKRDVHEFTSCLLVEYPNTDFGYTMVRQLMYSSFQMLLYAGMEESSDEGLASFATKSLKEVKYHWRHASRWVVRLGDGTQESRDRVQDAVNVLWSYRHELFEEDELTKFLLNEGVIPDLKEIEKLYESMIQEVLEEATLIIPEKEGYIASGGRKGHHSEHLGHILAEFQTLVRAYPDAQW